MDEEPDAVLVNIVESALSSASWGRVADAGLYQFLGPAGRRLLSVLEDKVDLTPPILAG